MTQRRIYQDEFPYFVTFRTCAGIHVFRDPRLAELLSRIILHAGTLQEYDVLAYQIMPDHVHVLINRAHPSAGARGDVSQYMHSVKSFFVKQARDEYRVTRPIWQRRFYTKIINTEEYLRTVIQYIAHNPVKENLPAQYHTEPYQYFNHRAIDALFYV